MVSITRKMPMHIVLLAKGDPEFPLDENRHSHHAHLVFYRDSPIASEERDSFSLVWFSSLEEGSLSFSLSLSYHLPFCTCAYVYSSTRMYPCVYRERLHACTHAYVSPCTCTGRLFALCAHPTESYPSFLCGRSLATSLPLSYSVPFPAGGTGRASVESDG